jgi:surface protein
MFSSCAELEYINLSHFDTSSLENMSYMFSACKYLRSVDVSSFDTSKVTDMEGVFNYCGELEDLPLSWDISSVKKYAGFMLDGKTINGRPWKEYFQ